jgi:hypothetical protein
MVEQKLDLIMQAISRGVEGKDAILILIAQAIPCIMHRENQVGEKIIMVLLGMASNKYQQQQNTRSLSRFCSSVQH